MTSIPVLLVTANVGSIFEDPAQMLQIWTEEFLSTVAKLDPKFIGLHCQEVGGKNYENSMKHVEHFVKLLMSSNELRLFDKVRVFLDEDYSSAENFTALGNLYFTHQSIDNVSIWDFKDFKFVPVQGKEIYSGNIEAVVTKEKAKFPQDFFPECKWSRKGFMRTRWSLCGSIVDLVNIHLFHDASNFIAMESYPSVYCKNRRRALEHTLQRFHNDQYGKAPHFLFGDFNFRMDTDGVIKKLTNGLITTRIQNNKNNEFSKLQYSNTDSKLILTIGKKEFNHMDHQTVFIIPNSDWLKTYDKEMEAFNKSLVEYPITFPPSYPFEENIKEATSYMQTRCPAWCDRVLLSHTAKELINESCQVEYGIMGLNTCMGDHKPVFLRLELHSDAGMIKCCDHAPFSCLPAACQCCQLFATVTINVVDMSDYIASTRKTFVHTPVDSRLLQEPITRDMLSHEPYTPESVDSHSPLPEKDTEDEIEEQSRRSSVSPTQLKTKLESILQYELKKTPKLMKRSASENVTVNTHEGFFRTRAMSEIPKVRARLISTASPSACSLPRLQSHHSSSEEEWFEYDSPLDKLNCIEDTFLSEDITKNDNHNNMEWRVQKRDRDKEHKLKCCTIV